MRKDKSYTRKFHLRFNDSDSFYFVPADLDSEVRDEIKERLKDHLLRRHFK